MLRVNGKTDYFYLYNGLGDVTSLVDSSNQVVVRYQYNSWGKVTSTQDTSGVSLATLKPFRYRNMSTIQRQDCIVWEAAITIRKLEDL